MSETPPFVEQLLQVSAAMLAAAERNEWVELQQLSEQREQLLASEAARQPPQPGTAERWREIERLNNAALQLAERQLQEWSDGLQSSNNVQKLQKRYSP